MNALTKPSLLPWAPEHGREAMPAAAPPTGTRPEWGAWLLLPARFAWRQLRAERARLLSAMAGVMFAVLLVFMQLGFRSALFDSAMQLLSVMNAELFLINPQSPAVTQPEPLPRARAYQALAVPGVTHAVPIYLAQAGWRNPRDGSRQTIQLIGFDPDSRAIRADGLDGLAPALRRIDAVAFDTLSRPEYGDIPALFAERGPFEVQVDNRMVELVGLVTIGPSFAADGNLMMSEVNFRRILRERQPSNTDLVAIRLRPGTDVAAAQRRLRSIMPPDAIVLTHAELMARERHYWETATPIGFIFAFGSAMGLIVGMVIVYQILFSDISNHLREYATLKAIGYATGYLARVVMAASLILAVMGFVPGLVLCVLLYEVVAGATFMPLTMTIGRAALVFVLVFGMCAAAGLLAMRKLRDADPADMF
ncbi:ABC transporter permease DevC [Neoroseomonas lacus]|uniref:ABC transporter n=1 Tax=Neoroseomonas lacus TaxID=287609 RepID=A0A917NYN0_9PROT|nr:ABC transporter permease DevC [Neoroseomonas lacus]GGJ41302.1 ABC transporter [Neoroseomonas lacus]